MQARNTILDDVYRKGDGLMHGVAWGMWAYALAIALIMKTSIAPVLLVGLPSAALASVLWYSARGRLISRLGMAAVLMVMAAVQIQVARGMNEMHFGVFVLLAFLLYYRDWRPIICAAGVIAVHHLVFDLMQARRLGVLVFEHRNGFNIVLLHALYVVFETAVLVVMAHLLRREAQASQSVVDLASEIARGRLNAQAGASDADGASTLIGPLLDMQRQLGAMVEEIRAQAGSIAGFTRELDASAATLAHTAERQSDDASSMASSIEQLTVSIGHVANRAQDAATVSRQSGELSRQGDAVIREASEEIGQISSTIQQTAFAIEQLGEQSQKISGIVHVIKEVAEQTNLLALNAAIEAARAGEQGRGFAVVADEVRKLAERTTHSTQEISGMVQSIQERTQTAVQQMQLAVQRVNHGVQLTEQTGEAIRRIREGAEHTLALTDEISQTLCEQSATSEDIARRVDGVAQGSQSSSQAAGVCADTAHRLHDLVDQMQAAIARFEVR